MQVTVALFGLSKNDKIKKWFTKFNTWLYKLVPAKARLVRVNTNDGILYRYKFDASSLKDNDTVQKIIKLVSDELQKANIVVISSKLADYGDTKFGNKDLGIVVEIKLKRNGINSILEIQISGIPAA